MKNLSDQQHVDQDPGESICSRVGLVENNVDSDRRFLLKTAIGAAATLTVAPALSAVSSTKVQADLNWQKRTWQERYLQASVESGVGLEFVDSKSIDGFMAHGQLTIFNRTHHDLILADFSPVFIVTGNGVYDVSAFLKRRPVRVPAHKQRHIWIQPETDTVYRGSKSAPTLPGERARVNLAIESSQSGIGTSRLFTDLKLELPNYKSQRAADRQLA